MSRQRTPEQLKYHRDYEKERRKRLTEEQRSKLREYKLEQYHATKKLLEPHEHKYYKGPIPTLDRDSCLYIAGLFDGEGCCTITTTKYRGALTYNPSVRIAMSHEETIQHVADKLDREVQIHGLGKNASPYAKTMYRVVLQNAEAIVSFLEQLLPFLITKKIPAQLMIEFCKSRIISYHKGGPVKGSRRSYTQQEIDLVAQLKDANHLGKYEFVKYYKGDSH